MPIAVFILPYAVFLGVLVYTSRLPDYVPLAVLLFSIISYLVYWKDKRASEHGLWRTPESRLHLLSLLGGWPGALIAQSHLRHKSSKPRFKVAFYITIFLNIIVISFLATQQGGKLLNVLETMLRRVLL